MSFIRDLNDIIAKKINGEVIYEIITEKDGLPIGRAIALIMESGLHHHDYTREWYHILSETPNGVIYLDDKITPLKYDQHIYIAPGTRHKVKANGQEPVKIDVITHPPWNERDHHLDE